ncbi:ABC transporter ATP-binding protein [Aminobacter sp. SR38]|jgi:putative spermidine/putrescine transport system ATP-binding protein|uniref:ABC transporter ATP-binding protein n=1 Tax=Aminobacter sp. SR38 TaxID=2774562 RepID=UPI001782428F|nr:ABC transporter ATP-binding protein [Aminobacter sp. SR38]QOF69509.1 ABC transporter ATP-binding protein [Aminobacter sp. SR38]
MRHADFLGHCFSSGRQPREVRDMHAILGLEERSAAKLQMGANMANQGIHLEVENLSHSYGALRVLHDIDFDVRPGEIVALLGPSGCGKTTILRLIAGFVRQTEGRILMGGKAIDNVPSNRRQIGLVFQNYALFPHLTVRENIGYGLVAQGKKRTDVRRRVDEMLELTQLSTLADRLPRELSGGQQQRVATGRALATQPRLMLLDEPFGALDKNLRLDMQIEFQRTQREFGITSIIVTHDQEEAFSLAHRVIVLNGGRIEQIAAPATLYDRPGSLFVNGFVGSTNRLDGEVVKVDANSLAVRLLGSETIEVAGRTQAKEGAKVTLTARPEHVTLSTVKVPGSLPGIVDAVLPVGPVFIYEIALKDGTPIKVSEARATGSSPLERGTEVSVVIPADQCQVFVDGKRAVEA